MRCTISCNFKFIKISNRNKAVCQAPVRRCTGFQKVCQILSTNCMNLRKLIQSCIIVAVFILIAYGEFKLFCFFSVFAYTLAVVAGASPGLHSCSYTLAVAAGAFPGLHSCSYTLAVAAGHPRASIHSIVNILFVHPKPSIFSP